MILCSSGTPVVLNHTVGTADAGGMTKGERDWEESECGRSGSRKEVYPPYFIGTFHNLDTVIQVILMKRTFFF
jgi:hypothetical protein